MGLGDRIKAGVSRINGSAPAATPPAATPPAATPPAATPPAATPPAATPPAVPPGSGFDPGATPPAATPPGSGFDPAATPPVLDPNAPPAATPPAATPPATPPAFVPYNVTSEDPNSFLGPEEFTQITALVNQHKVPKEAAEAIVKMMNDNLNAAVSEFGNIQKSEVEGWKQKMLADPEIMNEYGKNQEIVRRHLAEASPEFVSTLRKLGLFQNPAALKYFIAQGKKSLDDNSTNTGGKGFNGGEVPLEQQVKTIYDGKM